MGCCCCKATKHSADISKNGNNSKTSLDSPDAPILSGSKTSDFVRNHANSFNYLSEDDQSPGLLEGATYSKTPEHSVYEGTIHCITEFAESRVLLQEYFEKHLRSFKVVWHDLTEHQMKNNRGYFIVKSEKWRFGDTLNNSLKKYESHLEDKTIMLVVLQHSAEKFNLPAVDKKYIKMKTRMLYEYGQITDCDTNEAALFDIRNFFMGNDTYSYKPLSAN